MNKNKLPSKKEALRILKILLNTARWDVGDCTKEKGAEKLLAHWYLCEVILKVLSK